MLKEQRETLSADASVVLVQVNEQRRKLTNINDDIAIAQKLKLKTDKELGDVTTRLESVYKAVESAQDDLVITRKQQEEADQQLADVQQQRLVVEQSISKLTEEENRLLSSISDKEAVLYALEQQEISDRDAFVAAEALRSQKLKELDAKLLVVVDEINQNADEFNNTRDSLATWQKTLEERDKNLRVRELKVEQGEGKLIQNANLLNL